MSLQYSHRKKEALISDMFSEFRPANDNETVDAIPSNWKEPAPEAPPANPEPANNPQPQPPPAQQPPKPDENSAGPEKKPPPYEYKTDVFFALPAPPSPHVVQDSKKKLKNKTPGKRHSPKPRKPEKVAKHKN
ncbi:unnamed protein product [Nippostrongylus brasiliensis]|uniref:Pollen-specific leucine-rich repeat extensin-like protein 1 n=1 Tax=Nippostrongylus brasiliensis TaxID=27835 RepID=A0A0N4XIW8_NIPBR|nr:unnamed protein product [Nippostrongylus brasiliensis]